eukprot:1171244-Rhodomonas_salina.1
MGSSDPIALRTRYALSGTDVGYAATTARHAQDDPRLTVGRPQVVCDLTGIVFDLAVCLAALGPCPALTRMAQVTVYFDDCRWYDGEIADYDESRADEKYQIKYEDDEEWVALPSVDITITDAWSRSRSPPLAPTPAQAKEKYALTISGHGCG